MQASGWTCQVRLHPLGCSILTGCVLQLGVHLNEDTLLTYRLALNLVGAATENSTPTRTGRPSYLALYVIIVRNNASTYWHRQFSPSCFTPCLLGTGPQPSVGRMNKQGAVDLEHEKSHRPEGDGRIELVGG